MFMRSVVILGLICSLQAMNIHWQIDWQSDTNLPSGNYVLKELIPRLIKLDGILKKKIGALDSEIQVNLMILMGISVLMGIILVIAAHTLATCLVKQILIQ